MNVHEAKTHLSKLIERVEAGEEITIARNGKPVAKLVPVEQTFPVKFGLLEGQVEVVGDFDDMDEEIARTMLEGHPGDPLLQEPEEWVWPEGDR